MSERVFTGETDKNGDRIYVGDTLYNSFVGDRWNVVLSDGNYEAWLIPNSGYIYHHNSVYPMAVEMLCDIAEVFELIKSERDGGAE